LATMKLDNQRGHGGFHEAMSNEQWAMSNEQWAMSNEQWAMSKNIQFEL